MSNTITAYFKGRIGVAESVYQNDYGIVMAFDSIDLPAHFDCYFSRLNQEEALPGLGADNRVTIPNSILANPGNVTIHIPLHTGEDDSEVEYVIYFKVIGRARPIDDGTPTQMTAIERALALLSQPITNIEEIVNEALAFTGETFEEMQEDLDEWKTGVEGGLNTWKGGVEADFDTLQAQFDTAVGAVTTDTEVTDIRVGADGVIYTSAGDAVREQVLDLTKAKNATAYGSWVNKTLDITPTFTTGYINADGTSAGGTTYSHTERIRVTEGDIVTYYYNNEATVVRSYVAYVNGTADSSSGTTSGSVSKFIVPSGVTEIVANAWANSSGGTFVIETTEKNYENAFDTKLEPLLVDESVSVWQTINGWKLLKIGLCASDASYKLVKFAVTAGSLVKVKTDHMLQFQNNVSVPSSGSSNKVGGTYEDGEYVLKVPTGATYLIVSALASGSAVSCSKILTDIFGDENDTWEV